MANKTALRRGSQEDGNSDYFTGCPIGGGFMWFGLPTKIPSNCMICQDTTLAIASYAKLNENLGGSWGTSGGNLKLPDMRGRFPRGVDSGAGNDPGGRTAIAAGGSVGDAVGSVQGDAMQGHRHGFRWGQGGGATNTYGSSIGNNVGTYTNYAAEGSAVDLPIADPLNGTPRTTTESRPKNANVYFVIRVL
jgi:microcystin-dependent protein